MTRVTWRVGSLVPTQDATRDGGGHFPRRGGRCPREKPLHPSLRGGLPGEEALPLQEAAAASRACLGRTPSLLLQAERLHWTIVESGRRIWS